MGDKDLKVTDKRMFTPDGRLREEFRHLDADGEPPAEAAPGAVPEAAVPEAGPEPVPQAPEASPQPAAAATVESPAEPLAAAQGAADGAAAAAASEDAPRLEIPGTPEGLGAPSFLDLVTLLAEPIALYLGEAKLPDGESAENLEMARLHIDLLDVLRRKTAGNLEVGESRLLEDLLYRCRLRYVQKRG